MPPRIPKTVWMKSGGLTRPSIDEIGEVVEVTDVIALELEPRAASRPVAEDVFDVLEGVAEDEIFGCPRRTAFPVVPPILDRSRARSRAKFIDPMFSEHISGLAGSGRQRCSSVIRARRRS